MRDNWSDYQATGAEVVGVSVGTVESHKKFAENHGLPQRLLSDSSLDVARALKVKSILGGSQRAVIVIDADGIIRHRRSIFPFFRPSDEEVIAAIKSATA
jgi:peroxiredoxin Q/BCP